MTIPSLSNFLFLSENALFGIFNFILAGFRGFLNFRPGSRVSQIFYPGLRVLVPPKALLHEQKYLNPRGEARDKSM